MERLLCVFGEFRVLPTFLCSLRAPEVSRFVAQLHATVDPNVALPRLFPVRPLFMFYALCLIISGGVTSAACGAAALCGGERRPEKEK